MSHRKSYRGYKYRKDFSALPSPKKRTSLFIKSTSNGDLQSRPNNTFSSSHTFSSSLRERPRSSYGRLYRGNNTHFNFNRPKTSTTSNGLSPLLNSTKSHHGFWRRRKRAHSERSSFVDLTREINPVKRRSHRSISFSLTDFKKLTESRKKERISKMIINKKKLFRINNPIAYSSHNTKKTKNVKRKKRRKKTKSAREKIIKTKSKIKKWNNRPKTSAGVMNNISFRTPPRKKMINGVQKMEFDIIKRFNTTTDSKVLEPEINLKDVKSTIFDMGFSPENKNVDMSNKNNFTPKDLVTKKKSGSPKNSPWFNHTIKNLYFTMKRILNERFVKNCSMEDIKQLRNRIVIVVKGLGPRKEKIVRIYGVKEFKGIMNPQIVLICLKTIQGMVKEELLVFPIRLSLYVKMSTFENSDIDVVSDITNASLVGKKRISVIGSAIKVITTAFYSLWDKTLHKRICFILVYLYKTYSRRIAEIDIKRYFKQEYTINRFSSLGKNSYVFQNKNQDLITKQILKILLLSSVEKLKEELLKTFFREMLENCQKKIMGMDYFQYWHVVNENVKLLLSYMLENTNKRRCVLLSGKLLSFCVKNEHFCCDEKNKLLLFIRGFMGRKGKEKTFVLVDPLVNYLQSKVLNKICMLGERINRIRKRNKYCDLTVVCDMY